MTNFLLEIKNQKAPQRSFKQLPLDKKNPIKILNLNLFLWNLIFNEILNNITFFFFFLKKIKRI